MALYSNNYGSLVPNPGWELNRIFSSTKDVTEWIDSNGFYDDVRPITQPDRRALDAMPFDSDAVKDDLEVNELADGLGNSYLMKLLYYPTLNIAGFTSGYGCEGNKTTILSTAKLEMRTLKHHWTPLDYFVRRPALDSIADR